MFEAVAIGAVVNAPTIEPLYPFKLGNVVY
jgi:hypothetical protein